MRARALAAAGAWALLGAAGVAGAALTACRCRAAAPPVSPAEQARARLEHLRAGAAGAEVAGLALARIDAGGALHTAAVGCARFAPGGRRCAQALTPQTVLRVASISKLITAVVVMRLVQAGRLALEAEAEALLPAASSAGPDALRLRNPAFPAARITLRQLLSHTASLRDGRVYSLPPPATLATLMAQPDRFDREHPPGTTFHYDNINYVVLGAVVEAVTGERFDRVAQREVLAPAGVTAAGYGWAAAGADARARAGVLVRRRTLDEVWQPAGPWIEQVDGVPTGPEVPPGYPPGTSPQLFSPHGGLRISAQELARLIHAVIAGGDGRPPLLSPASLELLTAPVAVPPSSGAEPRARAGRVPPIAGDYDGGFTRDYALGNHRFTYAGRQVRAHFGDAYGLKGGAIFDPATGEVWVYLINGYGAPPPPGTDPTLPGLDAVEAEVVRALWSLQGTL